MIVSPRDPWRPVWIADASGPLTCSRGHRLHDPLVWEHGCLRCRHRPPRTRVHGQLSEPGPECGLLVYLIGGGLVNPQGKSLVILADVTAAEMQTMMEHRMDHDAALNFLGIRLQP